MKKIFVIGCIISSAASFTASAELVDLNFQDIFNQAAADMLNEHDFRINHLTTVSSDLYSELSKVQNKAYGGIASVTAMNNIPMPFAPDKTNIGFAVGSFESQTAFAAGVSRFDSKTGISVKGSAAYSNAGSASFGVGVGYTF